MVFGEAWWPKTSYPHGQPSMEREDKDCEGKVNATKAAMERLRVAEQEVWQDFFIADGRTYDLRRSFSFYRGSGGCNKSTPEPTIWPCLKIGD